MLSGFKERRGPLSIPIAMTERRLHCQRDTRRFVFESHLVRHGISPVTSLDSPSSARLTAFRMEALKNLKSSNIFNVASV